jgi:UDP-glucose 6-dehydrogenase
LARFVVYGHTGVVGQQLYRWLRERGADVAGVSLDGTEGDAERAVWAFLCLPTLTREDGSQDVEAIEQVCSGLASGRVVVRSTVLPGTTSWLAKRHPGLTFYHWPEFLSARTAWEDFAHPRARFVGCDMRPSTIEAWQAEVEPLLPVAAETTRFVEWPTSETIKYAHNIHGAMQIVWANQMYDVCNESGADWRAVQDMLPLLGYVSHRQRAAYWDVWKDGKRGYGGTCFPKDTGALRAWLTRRGWPCELLDGMEQANARLRAVTR